MPSNGLLTLSDDTATATILGDDTAVLVIDDEESQEDDGDLLFRVELQGDVDQSFTVDFATADGTAVSSGSAVDFTSQSGTLSFSGSDNEVQTILIETFDDDIVEGDESYSINLSNVSNANVILQNESATGTIQNEDSATIAIASAGGLEGDASGSISLEVTLDGEVQDGFSVNFATADGEAVAGQDFSAAAGTLMFAGADGEVQNIDLTILGDTVVETDEAFFVNLSATSNGNVTATGAQASITLANDDNAQISISDATVAEGDSGTTSAVFTLSVDEAVQDGFFVTFNTVDGTALAGEDYEAQSGQVNFSGNPGETQEISITVNGDEQIEDDEDFFVNLQSTSNDGPLSFSDNQGVGTIINDDFAARDCISVTSGNWSDAATWSCNGTSAVPESIDNVTLDSLHVVDLDIDATIASLSSNGDSALVVTAGASGRQLTCETGTCDLDQAAVTLNTDLFFRSAEQELSVGSVNGSFVLTLVGEDDFLLLGNIGSLTPLERVIFVRDNPSATPVILANGSIVTTELLNISLELFLLGDLTLTGPNVSLRTVNTPTGRGGGGSLPNLTVNTPGSLSLGGDVGAVGFPIGSLTVLGNGRVQIDGGNSPDQIFTSGGQIFEAELTFDTTTQLNAGFIELRNAFEIDQNLTLNVSGIGSVISAVLSGDNSLAKTGSGDVLINSESPFIGAIEINEGGWILAEGASIAAANVTVNDGLLGGDGTITGSVSAVGGRVAPGQSPGILQTGDLLLDSGTTFDVELDGLGAAGTDYDQLAVSGTVNLNNAALLVSGALVAIGSESELVLIDNDGVDPVIGTFADLPEGARVGSNGLLTISYAGGDGNDVVLIDTENLFSDRFEEVASDR
ncbi:MAG: Calx-beta domain-containing protein [Pseudomonadota bacterium]